MWAVVLIRVGSGYGQLLCCTSLWLVVVVCGWLLSVVMTMMVGSCCGCSFSLLWLVVIVCGQLLLYSSSLPCVLIVGGHSMTVGLLWVLVVWV